MNTSVKYMLRLVVAALMLSIFPCSAGTEVHHTPDHYEHAIRQAFTENRWAAGKYMLDESDDDYGGLSVFLELRGWYEYHMKHYQNARFYLMKALADDATNYHARRVLIETEIDTKNWSSAIRYINEQLQYDAYNKTLWIKKIYAYRELKNDIEADKLLERLYSIYPNDPDVRWEYTEMLSGKRKSAFTTPTDKAKITGELVKAEPSEENYMNYVNALLQLGNYSAAADAAAEGANRLKSFALLKKRVGILCEQNMYPEAIAYMDGWKSSMKSGEFQKLYTSTQKDFAFISEQYDPYIMHGRNYEKTHDIESLKFLINTSMSRGYWDDAIGYIKKYMAAKGESAGMLDRLHIANLRIGHTSAAEKNLERMIELQPDNADAKEELCDIKYKRGISSYKDGEYSSARTDLEYTVDNSADTAQITNARRILVDCYQRVNMMDDAMALADSSQRRELVTANAKTLMKSKRYADAYDMIKEYADSLDDEDLCQMFVTCQSEIGQLDTAYVKTAYLAFPTNEFFKSQYSGIEYNECMHNIKIGMYEEAIAHADSAIAVAPTAENKYAKGLAYEKLHMYDSAYVYQKDYMKDHPMKMKAMQSKSLLNTVTVSYQQARPSASDVISSNAAIEYVRKLKKGTLECDLGYIGRDESEYVSKSGQGVQIGGSYSWDNKRNYDFSIGAQYGSKYFPILNILASAGKTLQNGIHPSLKAQYRLLPADTYSSRHSMYSLTVNSIFPAGDVFSIEPAISGHLVTKKIYVAGSIKATYTPEELSKTSLWLSAGVGTAPEADIMDNAMPSSFNKVNTNISGGATYQFTKNLTGGAHCTWYTMYSPVKASHVNMLYMGGFVSLSF